jgi:ubiquitin carboxyl-terminal hydrolase 4/11/15
MHRYCSDCQQHVRAFKKFSVSRGPKILVVHLKRFSYRGQTSRERIDDVVHFPLHDLDISEFVDAGNDSNLYDLYAISVCKLPINFFSHFISFRLHFYFFSI